MNTGAVQRTGASDAAWLRVVMLFALFVALLPLKLTAQQVSDPQFAKLEMEVSSRNLEPGQAYTTTGDIPGLERGACPREMVVYVHGFQQQVDQATRDFNVARRSLKELGYDQPLVGFSWPSDTMPPDTEKSLLTALAVFPLLGVFGIDKVRGPWARAKEIANSPQNPLGRFLLDMSNACSSAQLRLVSHSLGARVVLSTLAFWEQQITQGNVERKLASVHLLAAAVHRASVDKKGTPEEGHYGVAIERSVEDLYVKFNPSDGVLKTFFPALEDKTGSIFANGERSLGELGALPRIRLPNNYHQENVQVFLAKMNGDPNARDRVDTENSCPILGCPPDEDHSAYNGYVDLTGRFQTGVMGKVVEEWAQVK